MLYFKNNYIGTVFFIGFSISFYIIFSIFIYSSYSSSYLKLYPVHNFMRGRLAYSGISSSMLDVSKKLSEYPDYDVYILGSFSYFIKLNLDIPIDKYDIINHGNMGYGGADGYISELDQHCSHQRCLFIINDKEALGKLHNQIDISILEHIRDSYYQEYGSDYFSVYTNRKATIK